MCHIALEGMVNLRAVEFFDVAGSSLNRCGEALDQNTLQAVGIAGMQGQMNVKRLRSFLRALAGGVVEHVFVDGMVSEAKEFEALCTEFKKDSDRLRRLEIAHLAQG